MTTKKTETQTGFEILEENTKTYTDFLFEATQKSFDQALAMSEKVAGLWLDAAKKGQELTIKQTEAAFQMAEAAQAQMKTASDRMVKMMKDFSAN